MPRGVPAAGFRKTKNSDVRQLTAVSRMVPVEVETNETDAQRIKRINDRFDVIREMSEMTVAGSNRAMIISGPAGLGKSWTVEKVLKNADLDEEQFTVVKGKVLATGLYKLLYQHRFPGQVIVFDDADQIFFDDVSLNLLKAVCDSTEKRVVHYRAEINMVDERSGDPLPDHFEFEGAIIFISNLDFFRMIQEGHRLAEHLAAIESRAFYIDTTLKSKRDYIVRIHEVVKAGMLNHLTSQQRNDVMKFFDANVDRLRSINLRTVLKLATLRQGNSPRWETLANITCCKA
jgi:hypothetical protein